MEMYFFKVVLKVLRFFQIPCSMACPKPISNHSREA